MSDTVTIPNADYEALVKLASMSMDAAVKIEAILGRLKRSAEIDFNRPGLKTADGFLSSDGIELCYRAFDAGLTRYAVKEGLKISFGAATHRFHAWEKAGGADRLRGKLSWES